MKYTYPLVRRWKGAGRNVVVMFTDLREGIALLNAPVDWLGVKANWVEHTDKDWEPVLLKVEALDG